MPETEKTAGILQECCATCRLWWRNLAREVGVPERTGSSACALDAMLTKYDDVCGFWKSAKSREWVE